MGKQPSLQYLYNFGIKESLLSNSVGIPSRPGHLPDGEREVLQLSEGCLGLVREVSEIPVIASLLVGRG